MGTQTIETRAGTTNDQRYLTFCLGAEVFGVEILSVREIIGLVAITPLPQAPRSIKGVMNLRGRIIPVLELRAKFGLPSVDATPETCVIVMEGRHATTGDPVVMGVIVDSVREVHSFGADSIEPPPSFDSAAPPPFIRQMGKARDKVVVLLDVEQLLSTGPGATG